MRNRMSLLAATVGALLLVPGPVMAHKQLKQGRYECWLSQIGQYSNYDLKIVDGNSYVFMLSDGSWKRSGSFARDGQKIRFTSGYLDKKGYKGLHDSYTDSYDLHTHVIYLYKGGWDSDDLKYDCNNN